MINSLLTKQGGRGTVGCRPPESAKRCLRSNPFPGLSFIVTHPKVQAEPFFFSQYTRGNDLFSFGDRLDHACGEAPLPFVQEVIMFPKALADEELPTRNLFTTPVFLYHHERDWIQISSAHPLPKTNPFDKLPFQSILAPGLHSFNLPS